MRECAPRALNNLSRRVQRNFYHVQWGLSLFMSRVPPTTFTPLRDSHRRKLRRTSNGKIVQRPPDFTGVKRLMVRIMGQDFSTPYGQKEIARRRAARKVAHESRRRNR